MRDGEAKLLYRHYSFSVRAVQEGFIAAEAAAEQDYLWQYIYLFFASQAEAERVGAQGFDEFLQALASSIDELEPEQWEIDFEEGGGARRRVHPTGRRPGSDRATTWGCGTSPRRSSAVPGGTEILQDSPSLDRILQASKKSSDLPSGIINSSRGVAQPGSAHRSGR